MALTLCLQPALDIHAATPLSVSSSTTMCSTSVPRTERLLREGWRFILGEQPGAEQPTFDDSHWQRVSVPHDWAITGPFGSEWDLQKVAVTQNGEQEASLKTGRTGGLPYIGVGWYRTSFSLPAVDTAAAPADAGSDVPAARRTTLLFDGAMSEARVYVNGKEAIFWPYGYNAFYVDITDFVHQSGEANTLAVRLENREQSSRWYCGAGLYRHVHLIQTADVCIPVWGTQVTTQLLPSADAASVTLKASIDNAEGRTLRIRTDIYSSDGQCVATKVNTQTVAHGMPVAQHITVADPHLWSPETPYLYKAVTRLYPALSPKEQRAAAKGLAVSTDTTTLLDTYTTTFGIRTIALVPDHGFFLNGQPRKFRGVCNHHDLGPLGAAINRAALRHQLLLLKQMGCDAIRTSHNMPAPELVELCDSMGFMMMVEPFDEWDRAKCKNGYHRFFKEWAERDMVNMLRHYRNSPSVVMWSIGNEVPTQCSADGYQVARFLQDICHREDPTRPVTCGMDQVDCVLDNGFAAQLDVPGFNYRAHRYEEAYGRLPQNIVLGSETSSTVSSRGVYKLPVTPKHTALYPDHQSSGYDTEYCSWSNLPDLDFANADDLPWEIGQFVWTGFDYLGEPSPYDTNAWPSHSSLFGIIDLASLPKDRYWLYRSVWNPDAHTLHILPHWTWPDHEGQVVPVFVYTDAPEAELFVNGKSQGIRRKLSKAEAETAREAGDPFWLQRRYRLIWEDVRYEAGEVKAVAHYDTGIKGHGEQPSAIACGANCKLDMTALKDGQAAVAVRTAGKPHHLRLEAATAALTGLTAIGDGSTAQPRLAANGDDLCYITVSVVDKDDNVCPYDASLIRFTVKGAGRFRAAANGDATNLDLFHLPEHHAFAGQLTAIVQAANQPGIITVEATAKGMKKGSLKIEVK